MSQLVVMWVRCACALALLCALGTVGSEKRAEMAPVPFVLGSRYGRSPPRHLAPRNDRFFMGSRYGKRSLTLSSQDALTSFTDRDPAQFDRQPALSAFLDRQPQLSAFVDRQPAPSFDSQPSFGGQDAMTNQHRQSPSLLWQAAALLSGRHRSSEDEP